MGVSATPRIRTERLELVALSRGHAGAMVRVLADPGLYRFTGGSPPSLPELDARYRAWAGGSPRPEEAWHNWVVLLAGSGEAIGHVQATVLDAGRRADIAWTIGTPWQGRGFASEAARGLVAWLEASGVATVTAHVHPEHVASSRVATRAGLRATAELEDDEVVWRREP